MEIEIIIPNYNSFNLIKNNLPRVIKAMDSHENVLITIVDDFSQKEEIEKLEQFIGNLKKNTGETIKLLKNSKNLGFSSTVNRGVFDSRADLIVLLNTDVIPENNFLDPIIEDFHKNRNLFGVGCMDKSIEGDKVIFRGRGIAKWDKGLLVHERGEIDKKDTFWISGGSSVLRRDFFEKLGGLDSLYNPFYWEDIDLSYRARKSGYELLFEKKSIVEHRHAEGSIKKYYNNFQIKTIAYRNQFIFIWKNITDSNLIWSHLFWLPYHMIHALTRFDIPFFLGVFFAIKRIPAIINGRSKQRKFYQRKDSALI